MQLGKGISQSHGDKQVKKVRAYLAPDELVVLICKCNNFRPTVDRLIITDRRVLAKSAIGGEVPYSVGRNRISRVEEGSSFSGATLTIATSDGQTTKFKQMAPEDTAAAAAHLSQPMTHSGPAALAPAKPSANSQGARVETVAEQLRQLAQLHQEGILSDEEFASAKAKMLGPPAPAEAPSPLAHLGVDNRDYYGAGQAPAPSTSALDLNTATGGELVAQLGVSPDLSARVIQARGMGPFTDFGHLIKQADLAPHEAVRFRGRVTFGLPTQPPAPQPNRPSGRVIDI